MRIIQIGYLMQTNHSFFRQTNHATIHLSNQPISVSKLFPTGAPTNFVDAITALPTEALRLRSNEALVKRLVFTLRFGVPERDETIEVPLMNKKKNRWKKIKIDSKDGL